MNEKNIDNIPLDQRRYRRVLRFFAGVTLNILWWEVALRRIIGKQGVARNRQERFRRYARDFRKLASDMGGVMIKLGQFIGARMDVMPPEIIEELSGLQDEVPPEPLDIMLPVIEKELGKPIDQLYQQFDTEVQAAASLGQVYRATLTNGDRVAVKVQRPGIEVTVATDLAALKRVARWMMYWDLISKRANVPALMDEFARTLWEELDYVAEADNAVRFRELFADDIGVYVPEIYPEYSGECVLTMEDVTSIKITDHEAIDAAGIDRSAAADRLLDIYLRMIFDFGFFHADPHPGNLFLYPLPDDAIEEMLDQEAARDGQPFYIVFVDFGMVGRITDQVKAGLREALIAVGTRDTKRVLKAYQMLGVLLPSADLSRIEEVEAEVMDIIWGKSVPELAQMPREEMHDFAVKYRDLLYEMPFQIPQDFIYLVRAVGILSGICTSLDPVFNPWAPIATYAEKLILREAGGNLDQWVREALDIGQVAIGLPRQLESVLTKLERGAVRTQVSADEGLRSDLRRVETAINGTTRALVFASLLITSTWLFISGHDEPALVGYGLSGISWLFLALRKRNGK